jgi:hypothetical protein
MALYFLSLRFVFFSFSPLDKIFSSWTQKQFRLLLINKLQKKYLWNIIRYQWFIMAFHIAIIIVINVFKRKNKLKKYEILVLFFFLCHMSFFCYGKALTMFQFEINFIKWNLSVANLKKSTKSGPESIGHSVPARMGIQYNTPKKLHLYEPSFT